MHFLGKLLLEILETVECCKCMKTNGGKGFSSLGRLKSLEMECQAQAEHHSSFAIAGADLLRGGHVQSFFSPLAPRLLCLGQMFTL